MRLISSISEMQAVRQSMDAPAQTLGLVPTMGALHDGHLSLVRAARRECGSVVVSIFVNPTQFGPAEDFTRYPRDLERDLNRLSGLNVEVVFAPAPSEMYPLEFGTFVEPGAVASRFEGASRPGHFRGVSTVVLKLFNIIKPDVAYFGQKDFQQSAVIRRLVEDFNLPVRLRICPIVREPDGLAMSSRNAYLSPEDRRAATVLYRSLQRAEELFHDGETAAATLCEAIRSVVRAEPRAELDYAAIVEPSHLKFVGQVAPGSVALVAARLGSTRLIDNLIFGPAGTSDKERLALIHPGSGQAR